MKPRRLLIVTRIFLFFFLVAANHNVSAQPLSGNYTIGGTSADFDSISQAVNSLSNNGVSGAVVFNVRPGNYETNGGTERALYIDQQITGASGTNTITFQPDGSMGGNVDNVILKRIVGSYDDDGWIVELKSNGIILKELTLDYADTSTVGYHPNSTFAGIHIQGNNIQINNISVLGCKIIRTSTVQRMRHGITVYGDANNIKIENNIISNTFDGVLLTNGGVKSGIEIINNIIKGLKTYVNSSGSRYGDGILVGGGQGNIIISKNVLDYRNFGFGVTAISALNGYGYVIESNSVIEGQNDNWGNRWFTGLRCEGSGLEAKIFNNMIASRSPGATIYILGSNCEVFYNTIVSSTGGTNWPESGYLCYVLGTGNNFYNNMFIELRSGNGLGALLEISDTTGNNFNYNCLYKAQDDGLFIKANGVTYDSLSSWQTTGYDINSISKLPEFVDNLFDLHLGGCSVYDLELQTALPHNDYLIDFDGEMRDDQSPYFGADEEDGAIPDIFAQAEFTETNDEALHIAQGDLDGDNDIDLAVTNLGIGSNDVSIFWNDGNANFSGPNHISFGNEPEVIKSEDIDDDNSNDLIATTTGKLTVRYGNPGGSFDTAIELPYQTDVEDFLFIDLDNDNDLDVFQTHLGTVGVVPGEVTQLINLGSRNFTFANQGNFFGGENPSSAVSGYINGDIFLDVVVVDYVNGTVEVLINLGAPGGIWQGFSNGVEYTTSTGSSPLHPNLAVGDIDGDNDTDILIGGWDASFNNLMLLRNNGDGTFATAEEFIVDDKRASKIFSMFDYENDGDQDLIIANHYNDLIFFNNDGNGNFTKFLLCSLSELGGEPLSILTANLNNDGFPDVAALTITDDIVTLQNLNYIVGVSEDNSISGIPDEYQLAQNYPNPFNPSTTLQYSIPQSSGVTLKVYDILGNEVASLINEEKDRGVYTVSFDASRLASGIYLYRLQAGSFIQTKKMILIK